MHLRHALAAAAVISAVGASTAVAGPPSPPPLMTCQDVCQVDPNYTTHVKGWVSDVRTWATSPPAAPHLTQCSDACLPDARYFVEDTKRFEGDVTEWLLP